MVLAPTRMPFLLSTTLVFLMGAPAAMACQGVQFERTSFPRALPEGAADSSVVARVEIVSVDRDGGWSDVAEVRVVEAIKGVENGQSFRVRTGATSCSNGAPAAGSGPFFVAGSMIGDELQGEWSVMADLLTPSEPSDPTDRDDR